MSDKRKFLYSASIAYGILIFVLLPIVAITQGSSAEEASVLVMFTVFFSLPVVLGLVSIGYRIFSFIKSKVHFNHYFAVFCGAGSVALVLSGLANIIGFFVMGEISKDMAGFVLYPTLTVSALASIVYLGLEKWS